MALISRKHKLLFVMVPGTGCSSTGKVLKEKFGGELIPQERLCRDGKRLVDHKHSDIKQLVKYGYISAIELPLYLKFATIRNPFDTLVTNYQRLVGGWTDDWLEKEEAKLDQSISNQEKIYIQRLLKKQRKEIERAKEIGFEKWLEYKLKPSKRKNIDIVTKIKTKVKSFLIPYYFPKVYPMICGVDEVIRYEHLETDFNNILKKAGIISCYDRVSIPQTNPTLGKKSYQEYYTIRARKIVEKYYRRELAAFGYTFDGTFQQSTVAELGETLVKE